MALEAPSRRFTTRLLRHSFQLTYREHSKPSIESSGPRETHGVRLNLFETGTMRPHLLSLLPTRFWDKVLERGALTVLHQSMEALICIGMLASLHCSSLVLA